MSKMFMEAEYIPADLDQLVDANGISKVEFDKEIFMAGFDNGTYYAGYATALFNAGLEEESVAQIILALVQGVSVDAGYYQNQE